MNKIEAQKLGAPGEDAFNAIFGKDCELLFAVHFEKVLNSEVPPDAKEVLKATEMLDNLRKKAKEMTADFSKGSEIDMNQMYDPTGSASKLKNEEQIALEKQRPIQIPSLLLRRFIDRSFPNDPNETMAWITGTVEKQGKGKNSKTIVYANGLFLPKQEGNAWTVFEPEGANQAPTHMLEHLEATNSVVVGWIHSHPSWDAFFSSLDQHQQFSLQKDAEFAFGLVVGQDKKARCLRLSPAGMEAVQACKCSIQEHPFEFDGNGMATKGTNRRYSIYNIVYLEHYVLQVLIQRAPP